MTKTPKSVLNIMGEYPQLILREQSVATLFEKQYWGAIFSEDLLHRYALWRIWAPEKPYFIALMLNPSTADEYKNDPTVLGICERGSRMGYGGVIVINAFAWRATSPKDMKKSSDPIGQYNDTMIGEVLKEDKAFLLCAWGADGNFLERDAHLKQIIKNANIKPYALALTEHGQPGHPLYIKKITKPFEWAI